MAYIIDIFISSDWTEYQWNFPEILNALSWPMEVEGNCQFHAFFSYSEMDEEFVLGILHHKLQNNGPHTFKLHSARDWIAGKSIPEQVKQLNSLDLGFVDRSLVLRAACQFQPTPNSFPFNNNLLFSRWFLLDF